MSNEQVRFLGLSIVFGASVLAVPVAAIASAQHRDWEPLVAISGLLAMLLAISWLGFLSGMRTPPSDT